MFKNARRRGMAGVELNDGERPARKLRELRRIARQRLCNDSVVMTPRRVAGLCFWIVVTSGAAVAQQRSDASPPATATRETNLTFPAGGFIPFRRVETTTVSGGRKVIIERAEQPGVEGKWQSIEEVVADTTVAGTQRNVFYFDFDHRPRLAETTQSEETRMNAGSRSVQRTWVTDFDGRFTLSSGSVEQIWSVTPGIQQRDATQSLLSPEGSLRGVERATSTAQQISPAVERHDSTNSVRDLNGRWIPTEARSGETRGIGSAERVEEETIQRQNLDGTLVLRDKVVTRTSESNGENRVVIETYSQDAEGFVRSDNHLALRERVRRSTTVTADGGRNTIEEIEARNPQAPNDPMRVVRRTLETVRRVGPGRQVTERQMFEPDANGRLLLVTNDTQETTEK